MPSMKLDVTATVSFALLIIGGLVALFIKHESVGAALIGAAIGQLGPSPVKAGK